MFDVELIEDARDDEIDEFGDLRRLIVETWISRKDGHTKTRELEHVLEVYGGERRLARHDDEVTALLDDHISRTLEQILACACGGCRHRRHTGGTDHHAPRRTGAARHRRGPLFVAEHAQLPLTGTIERRQISRLLGRATRQFAVGLGAQTIVRDVFSGVIMLVEDQYGVGDEVDVLDVKGKVETVGLRITTVRDRQGTLWYLRNGEILKVGNKSQKARG